MVSLEIYYTMLGYSPDEGPWDRHRWLERVHPDDRDNACLQIQEVLKGKAQQYAMKRACAAQTASTGGALASGSACGSMPKAKRRDHGRPHGHHPAQTDRGRRYQAQQALIEHEQQFRTVLENVPDFIVRYSPDLQRTYVNRAWEENTDLCPARLPMCRYPFFWRPPARRRRVYRKAQRGIRNRRCAKQSNVPGMMPGRSLFHLDYRINTQFGPDGKVASILCVGRDVTELKKAGEG